jgi:hypothetical protein
MAKPKDTELRYPKTLYTYRPHADASINSYDSFVDIADDVIIGVYRLDRLAKVRVTTELVTIEKETK